MIYIIKNKNLKKKKVLGGGVTTNSLFLPRTPLVYDQFLIK
jgi:hypothetical protein